MFLTKLSESYKVTSAMLFLAQTEVVSVIDTSGNLGILLIFFIESAYPDMGRYFSQASGIPNREAAYQYLSG